MKGRRIDLEKLRAAIHGMDRGPVLTIAERAIEMVPRRKLQALVGDFVSVEGARTKKGPKPLLDEVRAFHQASMRGDYYESFAVNSHNYREMSRGTDSFIAEFGRLLGMCIAAADRGPPGPVREAFDLLFGLLRHIDDGQDDVIFFADEVGSYEVGVDWRIALPAYFRCLAETASPVDFAREADRAIKDFAEYERPRHLTVARRAASVQQKAALRVLLQSKAEGT
jgi:hypothetical protein